MRNVFFYQRGFLFDKTVPMSRRLNGCYYLAALPQVRRTKTDKRPYLKAARLTLLQDNTASHYKRAMNSKTLKSWRREILDSFALFADLTPFFKKFKPKHTNENSVSKNGLERRFAMRGVQDGIDDLAGCREVFEH